jgi:hypothetical protein
MNSEEVPKMLFWISKLTTFAFYGAVTSVKPAFKAAKPSESQVGVVIIF